MSPLSVEGVWSACDAALGVLLERTLAGTAGHGSPLQEPARVAELVLVADCLDGCSRTSSRLTRAALRLGRVLAGRRSPSPTRPDVVVAGALRVRDPRLLVWLDAHWREGTNAIETAERAWTRQRLGGAPFDSGVPTVVHLTRQEPRLTCAEAFQATHLLLYATDFGRHRDRTALLTTTADWWARAALTPGLPVDAVAELVACRVVVEPCHQAARRALALWLDTVPVAARVDAMLDVLGDDRTEAYHDLVTLWLATGLTVSRRVG